MEDRVFGKLFSQQVIKEKLPPGQMAVVHASLELFSTKGFDETTAHDIAVLASVSDGSVLSHFKTKERLLEVVVTPFITVVIPQVIEEFSDALKNLGALPFEDLMLIIVRSRIDFFIEYRHAMSIFMKEIMTRPELLRKVFDQLIEVSDGKFDDLISMYQKRGEVVDWPTQRILQNVVSVMTGYMLPYYFSEASEMDIDQITDQATEFIVDGLTPRK